MGFANCIFIFLATIISLLIPSTKHDQAIRLVFGLVIFLLFLHPLTQLFNINPNQYVDSWESKVSEMMDEDLENEINSKKSEIQASQHAYILEQLQLEIRELVEKDLQEQFNLDLQTVEISLDDSNKLEDVNVDQIKTIKFMSQKDGQPDSRYRDCPDSN
ncbi:stage III sporulation protein AF [Piscibacillus salipiscarius]|uniref:stage III sporulation protein AF n=1 Tax=Piscibacillus salipiscarius TaxID=299480 RepID=UPI0006CFA44F|nr:stage III sporulation protein AF [Piscibacillus salipiscarius]